MPTESQGTMAHTREIEPTEKNSTRAITEVEAWATAFYGSAGAAAAIGKNAAPRQKTAAARAPGTIARTRRGAKRP